MTAIQTVRCDATPNGFECDAILRAGSKYTNATELRAEGKRRFGWSSVIVKVHRKVTFARNGEPITVERVFGDRRDFCAAHKHLVPKPADRHEQLPDIDYRTKKEN